MHKLSVQVKCKLNQLIPQLLFVFLIICCLQRLCDNYHGRLIFHNFLNFCHIIHHCIQIFSFSSSLGLFLFSSPPLNLSAITAFSPRLPHLDSSLPVSCLILQLQLDVNQQILEVSANANSTDKTSIRLDHNFCTCITFYLFFYSESQLPNLPSLSL